MPAPAPVWEHLPAEEDQKRPLDVMVNEPDLLPVQRQTYRYSGSLTTSPYSEVVNWFVMTTPIKLSISQLKALQQIFKLTIAQYSPLMIERLPWMFLKNNQPIPCILTH